MTIRPSFNLNQEQKFLLENLYKEFVRNGANLNKQDQDTLKKINQEISVLTVKFSQNVLDETNKYRLFVGKDGLEGLPESLIASAAEVAKADRAGGKVGLYNTASKHLSISSVFTKQGTAEEIFHAYTNRGNNGNEFDNNKILADIVRLRAQRAKLLGYKNTCRLCP